MKKIYAQANEKITEREATNTLLAREIASEGIVVLKNDGVLPIRSKKIALYGMGARRTLKGGTGSGVVNERHNVTIEEGLLNADYEITTTDWINRCNDFYDEQYNKWHDRINSLTSGESNIIKILRVVNSQPFSPPTGIPITESDIKAAGNFDVAIYVISRQAGEGNDRQLKEGGFMLDELELSNIKILTENFNSTVVVINVGGQIDVSDLDGLGINGLVYFGQAGQEGGNAFADIVSGEVCPSGKLSASWVKRYEDIPGGNSFGAMGNSKEQDYVEDIYVGYRYFDTFGVKPAYPFGFGLSYTRFDMYDFKAQVNGNTVTLCGKVKNVGKASGKETVQVYVTMPYGKGGAETKRLVAFYKTPILNIGEYCDVNLNFGLDYLTRYDMGEAAFVIEKGNYVLCVGDSSVDIKSVCNIRANENVIIEKCKNICPMQSSFETLIAPKREDNLIDGLPIITLDGSQIKVLNHSYGERKIKVLPNIKELVSKMEVDDLARLVIGGGVMGGKIVNTFGASGCTTGELYEKYGIPNIVVADGPSGLNLRSEFSVDENGNCAALTIPPAYDFGMFAEMMRKQMSAQPRNGKIYHIYATAMPTPSVVAQTFNVDLMEELGRAIGSEMKEYGVSVWLAPGLNIYRNPLGGRNFEYYSEDPVLSGKSAAAVTRGVQSVRGKGVSIKHFCCNNAEFDRQLSSSNVSERALREIYLRGFRIAVEESQPLTVMSSYNRVNGKYVTNSKDLLTELLRGEWGFDGLVMTDWSACDEGYGDMTAAIDAENDLIMPGTEKDVVKVVEAVQNGIISEYKLRRCATRVLSLVYQSTVIPFKKVIN